MNIIQYKNLHTLVRSFIHETNIDKEWAETAIKSIDSNYDLSMFHRNYNSNDLHIIIETEDDISTYALSFIKDGFDNLIINSKKRDYMINLSIDPLINEISELFVFKYPDANQKNYNNEKILTLSDLHVPLHSDLRSFASYLEEKIDLLELEKDIVLNLDEKNEAKISLKGIYCMLKHKPIKNTIKKSL